MEPDTITTQPQAKSSRRKRIITVAVATLAVVAFAVVATILLTTNKQRSVSAEQRVAVVSLVDAGFSPASIVLSSNRKLEVENLTDSTQPLSVEPILEDHKDAFVVANERFVLSFENPGRYVVSAGSADQKQLMVEVK
jgi:hypothetical protein